MPRLLASRLPISTSVPMPQVSTADGRSSSNTRSSFRDTLGKSIADAGLPRAQVDLQGQRLRQAGGQCCRIAGTRFAGT